MSVNSSDNQTSTKVGGSKKYFSQSGKAILLALWTVVGFGAARAILSGIFYALDSFGISFNEVDKTVLNTVLSAVVYVLALAIIIGVPWWLKKYRTTKQDIGLTRLPSWMDIGLAPAGFIIYFLGSALLAYIVGILIPAIDMKQVQTTGFDSSDFLHYYEYWLTFITLIVIAPIAEEIVFRGYLYGKLRKIIPMWAAIFITSLLFGAVHGQWNVAIDVFVLSLVLCSLREVTGNIWAGILLHMLKNGLAFYLLFINPSLLHTIGG